MKTKVKKPIVRRKTRKVMTTAIVVRKNPSIVEDRCGNCGKQDPQGALWVDPETQQRYVWCRSQKCKAKVQAKAPWRVHDHYTKYPRPRINIGHVLEDSMNDIELSNDIERGVDVVRGYSAKICRDAWAFSINPTDKMRAFKLFRMKPKSVFLLFNEDGKMLRNFRTYKDASRKQGKREVIVFWGGR